MFRSWEKICVVLKEQQLCFYKDQKAYKNHPEETFKGEPAVDLINCTAEVATDYTKKKYVFRLRYVAQSRAASPFAVADCPTVATTSSKQLMRTR